MTFILKIWVFFLHVDRNPLQTCFHPNVSLNLMSDYEETHLIPAGLNPSGYAARLTDVP